MNRALILGLALTALCSGPSAAQDPFLRRTATVRVVQEVGPSVVNITTEQIVQRRQRSPFFGRGFDRFFEDFFEPRLPSTATNLGSGVVIDAERNVLTNHHVVARARSIRVTLADGREFSAEVVGADPNNDLAVLRIATDEAVPWTAAGSSADVLVGEPVIAIGNPFGLSNTVTTGVLSAVDRSVRTPEHVFHGFLQTDASINPGNSGGPLLNAEGTLIGINTAIYQGAEGIGFAIPIDVAKRIVRELLAHGEIQPVWLGLDLQDLDPQLRDALGYEDPLHGALVSRVRDGSPAVRADLRRGDIVAALDGHKLRSAREFYEILEATVAGQELEVSLFRGGKPRQVRARAVELPEGMASELGQQLLGLELEAREGGGYTVRSVEAGGGAARRGIEPGDLLLAINGVALENEDALRRAAIDLRGRRGAQVVVQRGRGRYHVMIPIAG